MESVQIELSKGLAGRICRADSWGCDRLRIELLGFRWLNPSKSLFHGRESRS